MNLVCRKCHGATKHWKIGEKPSIKKGKRQRYQCFICGSTRYRENE
jgi:hypothetical protein